MNEQEEILEPGTIVFPDDVEEPDYNDAKFNKSERLKTKTSEKRKQVSPKQIQFFGQKGVSWQEIAYFYGINHRVLMRHFEKDYERGKSELKIKLRQKMVELALDGNVTMLIWLGKNILKMSDTGPVEEKVEEDFEGFSINHE